MVPGRCQYREDVYPPLVQLLERLDRRKIADLPWVGAQLLTGLLENV